MSRSKTGSLPTGAYTLQQMAAALTLDQLIACVREPSDCPLPGDVRIAIHDRLQSLRQAELDKKGPGRPSKSWAVQARMIHELRAHGALLSEAINIALDVTGEPQELYDTVEKKYQRMRREGVFENFPSAVTLPIAPGAAGSPR